LSQGERRADGKANGSGVDSDDFAEQINYLAALGRLVVPRAFAFVGRRILFVGHEPFDVEELGNLLPDGAGWHEWPYVPDGYKADVVVLGRVFEKGLVKTVLSGIEGSPKVIPQEGFLDELLFGHDWWGGKHASLQEMVNSHRGLQAARSIGALRKAGIVTPQPAEKKSPVLRRSSTLPVRSVSNNPPGRIAGPGSTFTWPSTMPKRPRVRATPIWS